METNSIQRMLNIHLKVSEHLIGHMKYLFLKTQVQNGNSKPVQLSHIKSEISLHPYKVRNSFSVCLFFAPSQIIVEISFRLSPIARLRHGSSSYFLDIQSYTISICNP